MKGRMAYLVALTALMACSDPPPFESQPTELTPARERAQLALPVNHGGTIILVADRVENDRQVPIVLVAEDNGRAAAPRQLTLYPPDRPARFALRLSPGATHVAVVLKSKAQDQARSTPKVWVRLERPPAEPTG